MAEIYLAWKDVCKWMERICLDTETDFDYVYSRMAEIPPADVRPVVRGRWINEERVGFGSFEAECSNCGRRLIFNSAWMCCPWCMADMRGDKNGRKYY